MTDSDVLLSMPLHAGLPDSGFRTMSFAHLSSGSGHALDQAIDAVRQENGAGVDSGGEEDQDDEDDKSSTQEQVRCASARALAVLPASHRLAAPAGSSAAACTKACPGMSVASGTLAPLHQYRLKRTRLQQQYQGPP